MAAEPPAAGRFIVIFWKKMAILMRFGSHFARFQAIWKNKIFKIWKPIEKITPFTLGQVQNTFKIMHFGVKFCDLAQVREIKVHCFLQHF